MPVQAWEGRDWENYCVELLRTHYGPTELQEMPSRHDGDRGIEAFTRSGCLFQCYAAEEPKTTGELYASQRDKLTEDLGKLQKYSPSLTKILGRTKVHRYVFMVHRLESSKIVEHAGSKAGDVRAWKLPFVSDEFEIHVVTDEAYKDARGRLLALPSPLLDAEPPTEEDVQTWLAGNGELATAADRKLAALGLSEPRKSRYARQLLDMLLESENSLLRLREVAPDSWTAFMQAKARKERSLELDHPQVGPPSTRDVKEITKVVEREIATAVPAVNATQVATLAWGLVADWIFRCPLDFDPLDG